MQVEGDKHKGWTFGMVVCKTFLRRAHVDAWLPDDIAFHTSCVLFTSFRVWFGVLFYALRWYLEGVCRLDAHVAGFILYYYYFVSLLSLARLAHSSQGENKTKTCSYTHRPFFSNSFIDGKDTRWLIVLEFRTRKRACAVQSCHPKVHVPSRHGGQFTRFCVHDNFVKKSLLMWVSRIKKDEKHYGCTL